MNWFGKTLRSFNVSGSSAIRFLGDGTKNPEAKRFHEMVRDLDKKNSIHSIDPCIDYFNEHFGSYEISELDNLRLNREATYLILQFLPLFADTLNDHSNPTQKKAIDHGFLFLEKAIFIFTPEPKNVQPIVQIVYSILVTNNEAILSRSMVFVSKCLSIPLVANLFYYQGDSLANLWNTCFVNNQVSCQFYGPLFTATAEEIQFNLKNPDAYNPFFDQVIESFRQIKFTLKKLDSPRNSKDETSEEIKDNNIENIQNALGFVAKICSKLNSGNFFDEFFLVSKIYFFNLPSLSVFSTFLACKTANPKIPWEAINEICKSEFSSSELLESAIEVVHGFLESSLITNFSFNAIIKRAKEISYESQELLFDIIERYPLSSKLDFFNFSMPPWETGINSQLLCDNLVKKNIWGQYASVMLSTLALKAEYNDFRDNLVKDKYIAELVTVLIDMVSNEEEISTILYSQFIKLAKEGIEVGNHVIEKIAHNDNVIIYLEQFLIALRENLVCDSVFDIYSKFSRTNLFFVLSFLENDGIQFLFPHLKSDSSLDFLASLASNGPYDSIDNYIIDHFKGSELSKHSPNKLFNLLMGLPQNSTSQGLLRIPSLLKFLKTEEISLSTQHDRFIFGTNAHKYGVDNRENLMKYSPTFISPQNVKSLCTDPEMLLHITSPNYPHFSVFECHKEAPHCTATLKLEVTTTFWIYVIQLFEKTVIMETPFGVILIEKDGTQSIDPSKTPVVINENLPNSNTANISFFGLPPLKFELKTWHMITLTATEWTFQQQQIVVYFNTTKIGEINGAVGSTVTLGSEEMNNAIYYLSSSFQTFDSAVTITDVKQMFHNGPQVFCPTLIKMKPGFQFIPYKGITKYLKRLGGKEFIFIQMRKTENYTDLIKLIQASFNMLNLGLMKEEFFFHSLRYILYLKMELIISNSKNEPENKISNWHPNFELILYEILDFDIQKKWKYAMQIFTDYNLLSTNNDLFNFSILPETFQHSKENNTELSSKMFHYLVDSYIVFNLTDETEQNILKSIDTYAKANPDALSLLMLSISAAAFVESNEGTMLSLVDDKAMKKQEALFQIVIDHMDLFLQKTKFEHALIYISTMRDELALDLLQMVAKIAIISPTYFDIEVFKRYYPFLTILSKYPKFWQTLMIFYTGQSADLIEDFADIPISRPEMTDLILDLLSHFIRYEISTKVENPYSFHVVKVVIKLLISFDVAFGDYITQIQHLSSLGFDQETPTAMPFSIDPNADLQSYSPPQSPHQQNQGENTTVPPKIIQRLTPSKCLFKSNEFNTLTRIQALDPTMYEETCLYLSKYNNSLSNMLNNLMNSLSNPDECQNVWKSLKYERYQAPENIEEYCKSEAVQIIANLVAMVFIQKANSSGISNKLLVKLLINGCDANPNVAQIMHRKIVYSVFAATKQLNDENYELFVKFVANRVLEGWWWNDDLFLLFQASFIRKTKSTKQLVFACIFQSNNVESQIRIMKELCTCPEFLEYLSDPYLFCCYIQLIARYEIVSNSLYSELRKELAEALTSYLKSRRSYNEPENTTNENTNTNNNENNNHNEDNESSSSTSNSNKTLPAPLVNAANSESINSNDPLSCLLQALINPENDYLLGWFEKYRSEEPNQALFVKYYNEMKKEAISNSKTIRDLRYDITVPPTYFNILKYQATRIGSALYIRRSFRYQFFSRFNSSNLELETAISSIFQKEMRLKFNENPADKTMIVPAPQPFVVPQKFDPLCYDFPIPQVKFSALKNKGNNSGNQPASAKKDHCINGAFFPHSVHNRKFPTVLPELVDVSQNAPKCYNGWKLPVFVMNTIPLDCLFSSFIGATSSLFDCSILMNPELLPGVAGFNNETFSIILNAQLRNYTFLDNTKTTYEDNGFGFSLYESNIPDLPINFLQILNTSASTAQSAQMVSSIINNYMFHGNLFLRNTSEMLSHFAIIENASHGIYGPSKLFMHHPVISFKFRDVLIAIPRRFVYQNQEVDIYFVNGLHLTLIMKESDRKQLLLHIRQHQQQTTLSQIHLKSITSSNNFLSPFGPYYAISLLAKSIEKVTKMWQMSEISTYDYLLYLNTAGGRSFNDLSQYPVFPWILGDFAQDKPILKRDLSKPMGTQTVAREARFISTFNETEPHCHYRTHYSQPAAVLHYMMRVEPFTFFNLHLHSGLDHRDRQFSSVNDAWRSASEANLSDLKELIPEFYTMPMFFENPNNYDFQCRSDGTSLGTVVLPPWTDKDPFKFTWQMRISLECSETSAKIGNWIDLIFGYKQRGQAAIDAINVFQPLAYDNAITTIMNESSGKSGGISGGNGSDATSANADITMNYALNANNNSPNNFIDNSANEISGIDSLSSFSIDMNNVKDYLSSIEQRKALTDAILQFGQCPSQLFTTPHPECDRNPDLQSTVINTASIYTKLIQFQPNCTTIQFNREKDLLLPLALPKFEHYVGNGSLTLVRVWDGYIEFGSASPIRIDSVDSCSSTCVSSDRLILATASRNGIIAVLSCTNSKVDSNNNNKLPLQNVNTLICPSFNIKTMAVTTQHAMLCAVSHKHIFLYDYTTGFLIKQIVIGSNIDKKEDSVKFNNNEEEDTGELFESQYENIISVIFDDISNFIVTISPYYITLYGLDLRFIARSDYSKDSSIPQFTCISISDFPFWSKMPLYITGHKDGSVYAWMFDVVEGGIFPLQVIDKSITNRVPISAVSLFMQNKAILAIDEYGSSFLATVDPYKASLHTAQIQQQKEQSLKEQSSLSSNSQTSLFSSLLPDVPSLPVASMPLKHFMINGTSEDESTSETSSSFGATKIASSSIPAANFSPFNPPSYSQPFLLSPNVFDTCRICGASIKGGVGYRCVLCCLLVCKQCIASKRPLICSYCKTQFSNANNSSSDSKETSDEPAVSVPSSSVPSGEIDKNKAQKKGMFANAFSFMKENKKAKQEAAAAKENANNVSENNKTTNDSNKPESLINSPKQEIKSETTNNSPKQENKSESSNESPKQENKSETKEETTENSNDQQNDAFPKLYKNNNNNGDLENEYFELNMNQIRRYSLVRPQFYFGNQVPSPTTKKSVINFDFGINSNSNDSSTETTMHEIAMNEHSEPIPFVPLKDHHSQKLTQTQIQMNMNMEQDEESSQNQKQGQDNKLQRTKTANTPDKMFSPSNKNDDFGTVMLRYREAPNTNNRNRNNNNKSIRRRYSFSHQQPHGFT